MFTGFLLLFFSNGGVMIAELTIPSSFVAVMGAATPFWFVVLDKPMWRTNFSSVATISGIILGFVGVCLLLGDRILHFEPSGDGHLYILGLVILVMSNISWAAGSLFAQKKAKGSAWVNTAWQMVGAGTAFLIASIIKNDWATVAWTEVTFETWGSLLYLIIFGSIAGYSAYVWLLSVRPAAQVSTYAYVNPIVALLLGYAWGNELITGLQLIGLGIILTSVLLINKSKHKKTNTTLTESKDI
jgi:drug/metabolite transporter (DMT)-like permease